MKSAGILGTPDPVTFFAPVIYFTNADYPCIKYTPKSIDYNIQHMYLI